MCSETEDRKLELDFGPVSEFGEKWRNFRGKYLTCCLWVEVDLGLVMHDVDSQHRYARFSDRFALDTASPVTFVRKEHLLRVLSVPFEELPFEGQVFHGRPTPDGGCEKGWILPELAFPQLGIRLKKAYISGEDHPFGLLGTDFLEHFHLDFDPGKRRAILRLHRE